MSDKRVPRDGVMPQCEDCGDASPRRHHCEACGKMVCNWCWHHVHNLPVIETTQQPAPAQEPQR